MAQVESNKLFHGNRRIHRQTVQRLQTALEGGRTAIDERLRELDREWDVERAFDAAAATVCLAGLSLAALVGRRWLVAPALAGAFLLQRAARGWCPPLALFRAFGFRTRREIETERNALKGARGDFEAIDVAGVAGPNTLLTVAGL
jgi:hypothetical protein